MSVSPVVVVSAAPWTLPVGGLWRRGTSLPRPFNQKPGVLDAVAVFYVPH